MKMSDKYMPLDRLRSFSETLSFTFELMRVAFKPLMILLLMVAGPFIVISAIANEYAQQQTPYDAILVWLGLGPPGSSSEETPLLLYSLVAFLNACVDIIASVVVVIYFLEYQRLKRLPTVAEVRLALRGIWVRAFAGWIVRILFMLLGLLIVILPGIYLSIALSIMMVVQFAESRSVVDAMKRSMRLIKDDWWWALVFLVLMYLCAAFVMWIVDIPGSGLLLVEAMTKDTGSETVMLILKILGSIIRIGAHILTTCLNAFVSTAVVVLYFRELERTEGIGLLGRIRAIGALDTNGRSAEHV